MFPQVTALMTRYAILNGGLTARLFGLYFFSKVSSLKDEEMTPEKIARKLCEYSYKELGNSNPLYYSYEDYWQKNRTYFVVQAEIYLKVKECLETKKSMTGIASD